MDTQQSTGFVIWLTGMNRAGKSSLAAYVAARLAAAGRRAELLDESGEAALLLEGLGSSKDDRAKAVARLGLVAKAVMRSGGVAVCAAVSPYRETRDALRKEARRFVEVFVDCAMEKLLERDRDGIYKKALAGELKEIPGVDVPYEPPTHAEVTVHTDQVSVEEAGTRVFQALVDAKHVGPTEFGRLTGGLRPRRGKPAKAARGGARGKLAAKAAARKAPKKVAARTPKAAKRRR
jgi:adenylylsulfate kinase